MVLALNCWPAKCQCCVTTLVEMHHKMIAMNVSETQTSFDLSFETSVNSYLIMIRYIIKWFVFFENNVFLMRLSKSDLLKKVFLEIFIRRQNF